VSVVADKLREARALVERGWTQNVFARTADGNATYVENAEAVCFCTIGALYHVKAPFGRSYSLLERAIGRGAVGSIAGWNDRACRKQRDVLAAYDKAIELAESGNA
jgi:hypothetical protein